MKCLWAGQEITEVKARGLVFGDGSELEADEIVFATGYQNMRGTSRKIFGDEVADRLKDVWGFDEEGELRTMLVAPYPGDFFSIHPLLMFVSETQTNCKCRWRRTGHPGFW